MSLLLLFKQNGTQYTRSVNAAVATSATQSRKKLMKRTLALAVSSLVVVGVRSASYRKLAARVTLVPTTLKKLLTKKSIIQIAHLSTAFTKKQIGNKPVHGTVNVLAFLTRLSMRKRSVAAVVSTLVFRTIRLSGLRKLTASVILVPKIARFIRITLRFAVATTMRTSISRSYRRIITASAFTIGRFIKQANLHKKILAQVVLNFLGISFRNIIVPTQVFTVALTDTDTKIYPITDTQRFTSGITDTESYFAPVQTRT